mmetsp:Transcript_21772/g.65266  ORF Transcript_21772/g.65266 Transcript_21772/m.65266 type:complete len:207 (+) Transcript_21772:2500-3120(+)
MRPRELVLGRRPAEGVDAQLERHGGQQAPEPLLRGRDAPRLLEVGPDEDEEEHDGQHLQQERHLDRGLRRVEHAAHEEGESRRREAEGEDEAEDGEPAAAVEEAHGYGEGCHDGGQHDADADALDGVGDVIDVLLEGHDLHRLHEAVGLLAHEVGDEDDAEHDEADGHEHELEEARGLVVLPIEGLVEEEREQQADERDEDDHQIV